MNSEQIHLLIVVCIIAAASCWFGFKAGTYYGTSKELAKIVREHR